jgi:hypothetical protein
VSVRLSDGWSVTNYMALFGAIAQMRASTLAIIVVTTR